MRISFEKNGDKKFVYVCKSRLFKKPLVLAEFLINEKENKLEVLNCANLDNYWVYYKRAKQACETADFIESIDEDEIFNPKDFHISPELKQKLRDLGISKEMGLED